MRSYIPHPLSLLPLPLRERARGEGKKGMLSLLCPTHPRRHAGQTGRQILRFAQNGHNGQKELGKVAESGLIPVGYRYLY